MVRIIRLAALSALLAAQALAGDLTISMNGTGKAGGGPHTQYWSTKFMRINNPGSGSDTLVDYEKGITYTIDHKKKVILKMAWDDLEAAMEGMARQFKDLPPAVLAMMPGGGGGGEVSVEDEGKETVAGRSCRKWKITMGKTVMETSNDPSLKPPMPAGSYARFMRLKNLAGAMGPAAASMKKFGEELAKIQGMALKTRSVMPMVGEVTSEATEVKEGPIPASAFALPEGYKLEDQGQKMAKQFAR